VLEPQAKNGLTVPIPLNFNACRNYVEWGGGCKHGGGRPAVVITLGSTVDVHAILGLPAVGALKFPHEITPPPVPLQQVRCEVSPLYFI